MKKIILIASILTLTMSSLFIGCDAFSSESKPFNKVDLTENNLILNYSNVDYYDTIISVGLDLAGVNGVMVQMQKLSDEAKGNFNGELKAHIRYYNGIYYLFIDDMDREQGIEVIAHEIIHILQYNTGQLDYDIQTGNVIWENQTLSVNDIEYESRPWETDAHQRDGQLSIKIRDILYN